MRVPASLTITGVGGTPRVLPCDVAIEARSGQHGAELSIVFTDSGTEWLVELDAHAAGYLSGGLAIAAGVNLAEGRR